MSLSWLQELQPVAHHSACARNCGLQLRLPVGTQSCLAWRMASRYRHCNANTQNKSQQEVLTKAACLAASNEQDTRYKVATGPSQLTSQAAADFVYIYCDHLNKKVDRALCKHRSSITHIYIDGWSPAAFRVAHDAMCRWFDFFPLFSCRTVPCSRASAVDVCCAPIWRQVPQVALAQVAPLQPLA